MKEKLNLLLNKYDELHSKLERYNTEYITKNKEYLLKLLKEIDVYKIEKFDVFLEHRLIILDLDILVISESDDEFFKQESIILSYTEFLNSAIAIIENVNGTL